MTVVKFIQPDFSTYAPSYQKTLLDGAIMVASRFISNFAPSAQDTPNMTVLLQAGFIWNGQTLTEVASQSTSAITAPVSNPRIDRIVVDADSGTVSVVAGVEAGSPSAPAIPAGKLPVARVLLQTSSTTITNSMLTDERVFVGLGGTAYVKTINETGG